MKAMNNAIVMMLGQQNIVFNVFIVRIELVELIGLIVLVLGADVGVVGELFDRGVRSEAEGAGAHEVDVGVDIVGGAGGVADEVAAGGAGDGLRLWGGLGHRWGCWGTAENGCPVWIWG